MARRAVTPLRLTIAMALAGPLCLALVEHPAVAVTAKTAGPQDLTRSIADPLDKLVGVWRVVQVEARQVGGQVPSDQLVGQRLRVDRESVVTLTRGVCVNPHFAEALGSFTITCLGQPLAAAAWNPQRPGTIRWAEGGFEAVLKRISGTEALPPGSEGGQ